MKIALLDLKMVRQLYDEGIEEEVIAHIITTLRDKDTKIIFLSSEPRTLETQSWLAEKELDQYTIVHHEDMIKNKLFFFFLKRTPSNWKLYFVKNLLENMDKGEYPPAEKIIFADSDEETRLKVFDMNLPRVTVYKLLTDAVNEPVLPLHIQEMSAGTRWFLQRKALEDEDEE